MCLGVCQRDSRFTLVIELTVLSYNILRWTKKQKYLFFINIYKEIVDIYRRRVFVYKVCKE